VSYEALQQCTELRDTHIASAVRSSETMEALLSRFAQIATPGKGAPILLAALARMGTTACDWIDGELRIEISGDATQTKIAVSTSIGAGFREKLFPDTVLRVPFAEFERGVERAPKLIEPLQVKRSGKLIVLTITQEIRKTSLPPPMVLIDPSSFMVVPAVPPMAVPVGIPADVLPMPRSAMRSGAPRPAVPAPRPSTGAGPKVVLRKRVKSDDPTK
jgi:hypothetical protein